MFYFYDQSHGFCNALDKIQIHHVKYAKLELSRVIQCVCVRARAFHQIRSFYSNVEVTKSEHSVLKTDSGRDRLHIIGYVSDPAILTVCVCARARLKQRNATSTGAVL